LKSVQRGEKVQLLNEKGVDCVSWVPTRKKPLKTHAYCS